MRRLTSSGMPKDSLDLILEADLLALVLLEATFFGIGKADGATCFLASLLFFERLLGSKGIRFGLFTLLHAMNFVMN
jgi:hypothetical protein